MQRPRTLSGIQCFVLHTRDVHTAHKRRISHATERRPAGAQNGSLSVRTADIYCRSRIIRLIFTAASCMQNNVIIRVDTCIHLMASHPPSADHQVRPLCSSFTVPDQLNVNTSLVQLSPLLVVMNSVKSKR